MNRKNRYLNYGFTDLRIYVTRGEIRLSLFKERRNLSAVSMRETMK